MAGAVTCTLKTEQPDQEVIQVVRTECEDRSVPVTISAAQQRPANTRSKGAQEMSRQVAQKAIRRCDMDHYKDIEEIPMIFGPRELSKILGISKNKTYEVVNRYDFPKIRVGRRIIISKKHFLEWMDANFGKERNNT